MLGHEVMNLSVSFSGAKTAMRPLVRGDLRLFCELYTNAETMKYIASPLSPAQAEQSFSKILDAMSSCPPAMVYWRVDDLDTAKTLGIMAMVMDSGFKSAEVGLVLAGTSQAKGYATDALATLVRRVFDRPGIDALHTRHRPENKGASGLMIRLGFQHQGANGEFERWQVVREDA